MAETEKKPVLVIDANVLIKHANLQSLALQYDLVTLAAVMAEVRDPVARARLASIQSSLRVESPDKQAADKVAQFAKKTGDFISLSPTDLQVIALAYSKVRDAGKLSYLRDEPRPASNFKDHAEGDATEAGDSDGEEEGEEEENDEETPAPTEATQEGQIAEKEKTDAEPKVETEEKVEEKADDFVDPDEQNNDDDGWISVAKPKPAKETKPRHNHGRKDHDLDKSDQISSNLLSKSMTVDQELDKEHPQLWYENRDFEPDDEEGWITPKNLTNIMQGTSVVEGNLMHEVGVGIMTSDYAMQMGIPMLAVDGMLIKQLKTYVLECFSCYKICRDNTKQFCPVCGNNTLLKVTCSFNQDGSFYLYRKRGYKFAIPNPTGGQRNNDLILSEDQLDMGAIRRKMKKREKYEREQFERADEAYQHGMGFDDIKKGNKHFPTFVAGYGRKNPNDNAFWAKKRGKK